MGKWSALVKLGAVFAALVGFGVASVVVVSPFATQLAGAVETEPPVFDVEQLEDFATRSYVFADDGSLLATLFGPENRQPVPLEVVPTEVVEAILAVEDADFWNHGGVNVRSIARAAFRNVDAGGVSEGGSTITQQLVKNALLSSDTNLNRKIKEAALALELERQVDKEEILETYLNTVYFGAGAYGVQAAAETYWGSWVNQLGWGEAALLAGLIANPSRYDPFVNPDAARSQRALALSRLVEVGHITESEAAEFNAEPLPTDRCGSDNTIRLPQCDVSQVAPTTGNYFVEDVRQALLTDPRYGLGDTATDRAATLYGGGLRIFTTLDPELQELADQAVETTVPDNDLGVTAAMVAVENDTGAVRAMVGGGDYTEERYNTVSQLPGRQTGSTFKTMVLLAALNQGAVPSDSVQGGGSFHNPQGTPNPYVISGVGGTLTSVTASSSNGAFVRLGQIVGLEEVGRVASALGLRTDFGDYPISLPLGTLLTAPIDMASAFSAIANDGVRNPAYMIEQVVDADGRVLYEHEPQPNRALTRQVACLATDVLTEVVRSGTATRARLANQPAAGKTGTTDLNADAWFVGFTPYVTTAVWMGNPDANVPMTNIGGVANFGGTFPAMVWQEFNAGYHAERETRRFSRCDSERPGRQVTEDTGFDVRRLLASGQGDDEGLEDSEDEADGDDTNDADARQRRDSRPTTTVPPTPTTVPLMTTTVPPSTTVPPTTVPTTTVPPTTVPPSTTVPTTATPGAGSGGDPGRAGTP